MAMIYSVAGGASNTVRLAANASLRQAFSSLKQQGTRYQALPSSLAAPSMQMLPLQSVSASALRSPSGFRKPELIEWREDMITNRATLIGVIIREVRIKYLDSGKIVANSSMKVVRSALRYNSWFYLEFWGDLAEVAAAHLKVYDKVFVAGSVWSEKLQGNDGIEKVFAKVVVEDLKFVQQLDTLKSVRVLDLDGEALWEDLFENSREWCDCREEKTHERCPDFKHIIAKKALWLDNKYTPKWVKERLERESDIKFIPRRTAEERWKDLFADPSNWWDNRSSKMSPVHPDFKHKSTREPLWINSRTTPLWVKTKLAVVDSKENK